MSDLTPALAARVVRRRFDADIVRRLQAVAWWARSPAWITRHLNHIRAGDIDALESAGNADPLE